jgi:hypothetical protein
MYRLGERRRRSRLLMALLRIIFAPKTYEIKI